MREAGVRFLTESNSGTQNLKASYFFIEIAGFY
jgi:hypothetical protein